MKSRAAIAGVLVALVAWGVWTWFPSEERQVRRQLDALAEIVTSMGGESTMVRMAQAASLRKYFADDITVDLGGSYGQVVGRDALMALVARAPLPTSDVRIEFVDVRVTVSSGSDEATTYMTAKLTWRDQASGSETVDAREVEMALKKGTDGWRIHRVQALPTLGLNLRRSFNAADFRRPANA